MKATGTVPFTLADDSERLIAREALRDLRGRFGGISMDAPDEELLDHFADKITAVAIRHPDVIITSAHFFP